MSEEFSIIKIRVREGLKKKINIQAAEENISLQDLIERAVKEFLQFLETNPGFSLLPTIKGSGELVSYNLRVETLNKLKEVAAFRLVAVRVIFYSAIVFYFENKPI
jgi:hypothetical protein